MIVTDKDKDRRRPLPTPPTSATPTVHSGEGTASTDSDPATTSSEPPSSDWPAPPPYSPSDPASSSSVPIPSGPSSPDPLAPRAAHDAAVDLLDGDPSEYSAGPSVPPPATTVLEDEIPPLPRQNHLRIHREGQPISETLVLDPSLPAPPGTAQKNLELSTKSGPVLARVYITEVRDLKRRVELSASSDTGPVKLEIASSPRTCRLAITASSSTGPCAVYLPLHFTGPLTVHTKYGFVSLSPSLQARCRTFEESSDVRSYWVGEWTGGEEWEAFQQGEWAGDQCEVTTNTGPVRLGYWEGISTVERVVGGIFRKLFG
ncbi:hypothetical protein CALCODRAFT_152143 [Calocera cornea HHB12733]|uniref:DUF7330 domain-containing protein n=1 Tax=Calocera cornea HHB12733 TaxID=1353952 RepID=A0A165CNN6_9BASI|nr:hypothetical protein CALCODRAFT_152143 [Calocera cornea HHB12733]